MTIIDAINQARHRRSARREYTRLQATAAVLSARLYTLTAPAERAALLTTWAETHTAMAVVHQATGTAKNTRFQPHQESEVIAMQQARAGLLRLAAASEWMLTLAEAQRELDDLLTAIPPAEAQVWLNLAHNHSRADRAELLTYIADMASERLGIYAASQRFGDQAAEVLNDVADAERELAAGRITPIASQSASRWGSVALFTSGAAMIAIPMVPGFNHWPTSAQALADLGGPGLLAVIAGTIWRYRARANRRVLRGDQGGQEVSEEAMPSQ